MSVNDRPQSPAVTRTLKEEALAAQVSAAADAALAAFHATSDERRRIHRSEWDQPEQDSLWDIDEVADALHGFASWALSGMPHPERPKVLQRLRGELAHRTNFDLLLKLRERCSDCERLISEYLGRLRELREILVSYFEEESKAVGAAE
jgi:hypothetical protein